MDQWRKTGEGGEGRKKMKDKKKKQREVQGWNEVYTYAAAMWLSHGDWMWRITSPACSPLPWHLPTVHFKNNTHRMLRCKGSKMGYEMGDSACSKNKTIWDQIIGSIQEITPFYVIHPNKRYRWQKLPNLPEFISNIVNIMMIYIWSLFPPDV